MVDTKIENSAVQLAAATRNKRVWGPLVINVKDYGAKGDGVTDDSAAINLAISTAQAQQYEPEIRFPAGRYRITSPIIIRHGTVQQNVNIMGYGAQIIGATAGMRLIVVQAYGSPTGFAHIGLTRIQGLRLYGTSDSGSVGIFVGRTSVSDYGVDGVFPSLIKDVTIENVQYGVVLSDARLWQLENVTADGNVNPSYGILFQSSYDGFTGDCWVKNCQLASTVSGIGIRMLCTSISGTSRIGGIHITDTVCYGQGIELKTTNSPSIIADIWLTSFACDGTTDGNGISISNVSGGAITQVFITQPWVNAYFMGMSIDNASAITIIGGKVSSTDAQAIDLKSCFDVSISGTKCNDVNKDGNGGGIIKLGVTGSRNSVKDCRFGNTGGYGNQFIYIDSTQVKPIVTNNIKDSAGSVFYNNISGTEGTEFIVSGNL